MTKNIRKIVLMLIMFTLILVGMSTVIKAEDTSFSLDKTTLDLELNSTRGIYWSNKPSGETITWTSSNPNVATVDNNGTVKGVSIGNATITATVGGQTATCQVSVIYGDLAVKGNDGFASGNINLVLGEHPVEILKATVRDGQNQIINNATITWTSSNPSVATVDNTGKVTAVSAGKTNITASVAGATVTREINVLAAPVFTDFSNAKYELLFDIDTDLKISGIKPIDDSKNTYYYVITSTNKKPNISMSTSGSINTEVSKEVKYLSVNAKENYIYSTYLDNYVELNQDLYLWVIQDIGLGDTYYDENGNSIWHSTKFVVEGKKLTRPALPQLNLILKSFSIGKWESKSDSDTYTSISFRFPSAVENRNFKIKIGKVTDNSILQKIQKGDYSGVTDLLAYAKKNDAVYTADLTTTGENYYRSEKTLFDGRKLLQDKAYYYIYVQFDDENGKYYPIEGVTLGQAWFATSNTSWDLYAYTNENFKWNNLSSTYTQADNTIAKVKLPNTGVTVAIAISIVALAGAAVVLKIKKDKYKGI